MLHHSKATNPNLLDKISDGLYIPFKLVSQMNVDGKIIEEHFVDKAKF